MVLFLSATYVYEVVSSFVYSGIGIWTNITVTNNSIQIQRYLGFTIDGQDLKMTTEAEHASVKTMQ